MVSNTLTDVGNRVHELLAERDRLAASGSKVPDEEWISGLHEVLAKVEQGESIQEWFSGSVIEQRWGRAHSGEEQLDEFEPDEVLLVRAQGHVDREAKLSRDLAVYGKKLLDPGLTSEMRREAALQAISASHRASTLRHRKERRSRNGAFILAAVLLVFAAAVAIVQATTQATIIGMPDTSLSAGALLPLVMLAGAVGGAIGAMALYTTGRQLPVGDQYDMRIPRAVAKLAVGLWTGVAGVWMISSSWVDAKYTSVGAALLLALMFGFAQEALTRFFDRYVRQLLEPAKVSK